MNNEKLKKHPRQKHGFFSHLFFCWQISVITKTWKQKSFQENLYTHLHEYDSHQLGDKLERLWQNEETSQKNPSLTRALFKLFGPAFICYGILLAPSELSFLVLQNFSLQKLLEFYSPNQTTVSVHGAHLYASIMIVVPLCRIIVYHWTLMELSVLGLKMRVACSSLIYRKALKLKQNHLDKVTAGRLLNLLSNDVNTFDRSFIFMHWLWLGPVNLMTGSIYLYFMYGSTAIAGVPAVIAFALIQLLLTKIFSNTRTTAVKRTDHRIQIMTDVIGNMHAVKVYAWDKPFKELVEAARRSELKTIFALNLSRLTQFVINFYTAKVSLFLAVLATVLTDKSLTSQYFFGLSHIYELLKLNAIIFFEFSAVHVVETTAAIERIQEYLLIQHKTDHDKNNILKSYRCLKNTSFGILVENATIQWNSSSSVVLTNVNFKASSEDLIGVIGPAGSGKSALLHAILGETEITTGNITVGGVLSFASQEPWIFSASIRQNVVFGEDFVLEKYTQVIKVCGLERDLHLFDHGDQTLVGEKGVKLSGGQRARINLARAVYRDADIYLLDDPLSAIDVRVARHIFDECIRGYLKKKCVVLVTHQEQFVHNADYLYSIDSSRIKRCKKNISGSDQYQLPKSLRDDSVEDTLILGDNKLQTEVKENEGFKKNKRNIYVAYAKAVGCHTLTCFTLALLLLTHVISTGIYYFMSFWTNLEQGIYESSLILTTVDCLCIYASFLILLIVIAHSASLFLCKCCYNVSKRLHDLMLLKILHASMKFFNEHSSGRILNRFTIDTGTIDLMLPYSISTAIVCFFMTTGFLSLIVYCNYWMAVPSIVLITTVSSCFVIFQPAHRNMKRSEGTTRSELLAHLSSSIQGLSTIRTFGVEKTITQEFDNRQNCHSTAVYLSTACYSAFGFWVDLIYIVFNSLVIVTFFFVDLVPTVGNVGLAIYLSSALIQVLQYFMKNLTQLEGNITSVERVLQYIDVDPEADDGTYQVPPHWPNFGNICFQSVSLRYVSEGSFVLRNVSFDVKPGEKVGIVGRTGAGKTSLFSVLLRLFDFSGDVLIDGVNTKSIPLDELRSRISIIPQEPFLFSGSVRKNVDPFNEYRDDEIWRCLEDAGLKEMVSELEGGLNCMILERGSNFSAGEKQLLCLVRVMLRKNKIVVLDKATANVDLKTDELIQAAIKTKFVDCTVLTIAHRLNTVIDYDKILVMDGGTVVEFGQPDEMLRNRESYLYNYYAKND